VRVTGGIFRGRNLQTASAAVLRPTQDRVREALFSSLADLIPGCAFLDLYAGVGSVGIEAWSRGAALVGWVEGNRRIFQVLEGNIRVLASGPETVRLMPCCMDVGGFCRRPPVAEGGFDVVYADPPYARNRKGVADILPLLVQHAILKPDGLFVLEQGADAAAPVDAGGWMLDRERRYGGTMLRFFRRKGEP
jgi:16S rRNA (guanine966-N2)-methyltransferase